MKVQQPAFYISLHVKYFPFNCLLILAALSCNENSRPEKNIKLSLGTPKATATNQPNTEIQTGPLVYGPNVPLLKQGNTVDVKIDVKHKLFEVKKEYPLPPGFLEILYPGQC